MKFLSISGAHGFPVYGLTIEPFFNKVSVILAILAVDGKTASTKSYGKTALSHYGLRSAGRRGMEKGLRSRGGGCGSLCCCEEGDGDS